MHIKHICILSKCSVPWLNCGTICVNILTLTSWIHCTAPFSLFLLHYISRRGNQDFHYKRTNYEFDQICEVRKNWKSSNPTKLSTCTISSCECRTHVSSCDRCSIKNEKAPSLSYVGMKKNLLGAFFPAQCIGRHVIKLASVKKEISCWGKQHIIQSTTIKLKAWHF